MTEPRFTVDKRFLQSHALFGGFTSAELDIIMPLLDEESFPAGHCIVEEGRTGDRLYFIETGYVEVLKRTRDGELARLGELGPGDEFGEMELIDIHPRSATVRALEPVVALSLTNGRLLQLYHDHLDLFSRLLLNLAREISRRLRRAEDRLL